MVNGPTLIWRMRWRSFRNQPTLPASKKGDQVSILSKEACELLRVFVESGSQFAGSRANAKDALDTIDTLRTENEQLIEAGKQLGLELAQANERIALEDNFIRNCTDEVTRLTMGDEQRVRDIAKRDMRIGEL